MSEARELNTESPEAPSLPHPLSGLGHHIWPAILSLILLTFVTGACFPLVLAALARSLFPYQSKGSLISGQQGAIGSALIGQNFSDPAYFHPRPSAAGDGYDATASGGANFGPTNPELHDDLRKRVEEYRRRNELAPDARIPIDAVTRSGSGLDPHISPANALLQVPRIASVRSLDENRLRELIAEHTENRQLGFLGEARVSVLALNLALDRIASLSER